MNTQNLQNKIKRYGLAFAMLFSFVLLSGVSAQAQNRDGDGNNRRDGMQDNRSGNINNDNRYDTEDSLMFRSAAQFGNRDGANQGRRDAQRNRASNCQGAKHYQNARRGYDSRNGTFPAYQRAYRGGFSIGYDQAFGNTANRRNRRGN